MKNKKKSTALPLNIVVSALQFFFLLVHFVAAHIDPEFAVSLIKMYGEHCISACSHTAMDICSQHAAPLFLIVGDNSYVYHCRDFISNPD